MGQAQVQLGANIKTIDGVTFVGSNIPAFGNYIGQRIQVTNPAVPSGRSYLAWSGSVWTPPAGEILVVANVSPITNALPVADITPGVTSVVQIYQSPIIPNYMLPIGLRLSTISKFRITNSGSGVAGALMGCGISGNIPNMSNYNDFPNGTSVTPPIYQLGNNIEIVKHSIITSTKFGNCPSSVPTADNDDLYGLPYVSNSNRLYCTAKPSSVTDRVFFWWGFVISEGVM